MITKFTNRLRYKMQNAIYIIISLMTCEEKVITWYRRRMKCVIITVIKETLVQVYVNLKLHTPFRNLIKVKNYLKNIINAKIIPFFM